VIVQLLLDVLKAHAWLSPVKVVGAIGIIVALILHAWYMEGRERIRWAAESIPLAFGSPGGMARYSTPAR
jgi:membrane associated rhomboid family serine protease